MMAQLEDGSVTVLTADRYQWTSVFWLDSRQRVVAHLRADQPGNVICHKKTKANYDRRNYPIYYVQGRLNKRFIARWAMQRKRMSVCLSVCLSIYA